MRFDTDNSQVLKNPTESDFAEVPVLEGSEELLPKILPKYLMNQLLLDLPEKEVSLYVG
jgi:hypothetical protein